MKKLRALLIIDAQKGFSDPCWGSRNQVDAESKMKKALDCFRINKWPVIHVQHLSQIQGSPLSPEKPGAAFIEELKPIYGERVFQKKVNSAFIGTGLSSYLREAMISHLVVSGFTTDHCVSTSVRMAANLGFKVDVLRDATVAFERKLSGKVFSAELVQEVSLASLEGEFANIIDIDNL